MRSARFGWWTWLIYGLGLIGMAAWFRHALNADAVAYLRLASYYAHGQWDLAVSGYWGPLASWLMAPFLKLGLPPLAVGRGFMVFSALAFLGGCRAVFRVFELPQQWERTGTLLAAAAGLYWSVQFITPDLLLSGLVALAASRTLESFRSKSRRHAWQAGLCWGAAYFAKAIAFPLGLVVTGWLAVLALKGNPAGRAEVVRRGLTTIAVFGLIAAPWVMTLSVKYGGVTFSTTPRISHTLTGPPDRERYHPFARAFQRPPAGRITSWEEPSRMAYQYWSPFENSGYALHQVKILLRNLSTGVALLITLNIALVWLAFAFPLQWLRRKERPSESSRWARPLVVPATLLLLYLPTYFTLTEQRFFYPALPFVFSALALWGIQHREQPQRKLGWWMTAAGGLIPVLGAWLVIGTVPKVAGDCAADLASRLARCRLSGAVAGSGMLPGGRTGLYVAFLLGQPWYGDKPGATPAELSASGARLAIVRSDSNLGAALEKDPRFRNLNPVLFADSPEERRCPLSVYEITRTVADTPAERP